ncbi:MAG: hypothetical protein JWR63_3066, partial [Conexibacter sp.]|nr:hypothetical protein [Conexibacter sp.]
KPRTTDAGSSTTAASATAATTLPGAPAVVAYPTRAGEVGGLPLSAAGVLLGVLGIAALVLAGLGLRRLAPGPGEPPHPPQVSGP